MPYYEYEYIIENLIDILEKKKEAEESENEKAGEGKDNMMSKARGMMPKMPNMGSMSSNPSMPKMPSGGGFPSIPSNLKI
jgi:hypothetical protein